jgi:hypothetical protein
MKSLGSTMSGRNPVSFGRDVGVSKAARSIVGWSDKVTQNFASSISFGDHLCRILEGLLAAMEEYYEENADAAQLIDEQSFDVAQRFALSLSADIPIPEIDITPTGQVVFTWSQGARRIFSVIIGSRSELSYAGLFGARRTHGVEYFDRDVPDIILENIARVDL